MQNRLKVLCYFLFMVCLQMLFAGCQTAPLIGSEFELDKPKDGVYEGTYRNWPNKAVTKVTISGGRIVNVELIEHFASWKGKRAEKIIPGRIVEQQSTRVDAVTGATNSSRVIMNAVQRGVEEAYK